MPGSVPPLSAIRAFELRGPYFVLVTLALGLSARLIVINVEFTGSSTGLYLPFLKVSMFTNRVIFYEVMLAIAFIIILIAMWIEKSKFGLGLRSIYQDEDSAETQGVDATRLKIPCICAECLPRRSGRGNLCLPPQLHSSRFHLRH